MANYQQYTDIKNLIAQYCELKHQDKYAELMTQLAEVLDL